MEEQIKHVIKTLKISYIVFGGLALLLVLLGEMDVFPVGLYADDVRITYYFETMGILLTAIFIPLALKLFSLVLNKQIDKLSFPIAIRRYVLWSNIRLVLLESVVIINLLCYYFTYSSTGALCALIGLTASLFCLPGEKRFRKELHIFKEE